MSDFQLAQRLATLPPYLSPQLTKPRRKSAPRAMDIISLGIGDPDLLRPTSLSTP
jgi:LL-diaminopimelate aminotransferase